MALLSPESLARTMSATLNAKDTLKPGDLIRAARCGGKTSRYVFDCWDKDWIVSKTGIDDIAAIHIDKLNGESVDFGCPMRVSIEEAKHFLDRYNKAELQASMHNVNDEPVPF